MGTNSKTTSIVQIVIGAALLGLGAMLGQKAGVYLVESWWTILLIAGGFSMGLGAKTLAARG